MGHYCWCCESSRPNEAFSGKGHRRHLCKRCAKLPKEDRAYRQAMLDIYGFMRQRNISKTNIARLSKLTRASRPEIAELASLVLQVAKAKPHRRRRIRFLMRNHRGLLQQLVSAGLIELFDVFEQIPELDELGIPEELGAFDGPAELLEPPDWPWEDSPEEEAAPPDVIFDCLEPEIPF